MKRVMLILLIGAAALFAAGCQANDASAPRAASAAQGAPANAIEIPETVFIEMINDIYLNSPDYLGKTLTYEGIFTSSTWAEETYHYVIRYGPGCCAFDEFAGFEVVYGGALPSENDWVRATGVLEEYTDSEGTFLRLSLSELSVLDTRGAEYVQ